MKKIVALLLALIMVTSMLPTMVFAEDGEETVSEETVTEEVTEPEEEPVEEETEPEEEAEEAEEEISETVPAANAVGDTETVYVGTAPKGDLHPEDYFDTLQDAVASVVDSTPTTIVMKKNITIDLDTATSHVGVTIPMGRDITLDLNGKTIVGTCTQEVGSALIKNNGTLTIMDSTDYYKNGENCGYIVSGASPAWEWDGTNNYSGSYGSYTIETNGTLTINSGWVRNISDGSAVYVIENYGSGKVYINGGKVYQDATNVVRMNQNTKNANMLLEINGGIVCGYRLFNLTNTGMMAEGNTYTININGGHIIGASYDGKDYMYPYQGATLNITGGQIDCGMYAPNATTSVTGGTFDVTKMAYITFPSGSLTVPEGSDTGATFDFRAPDYNSSTYTAKGYEYNGKLYNVTAEGGRGTMKSGDENDWDTVEGWRNAGYVVVGPFDSGDDGDYYRFYTPYDEEDAASEKEYWIGKIESALGQNCMLRDNGDNTYTVVRAYAKVYFVYYEDYTYTAGDHESTYYDDYDGWYSNSDYFETVQEALDAEQELEEYYLEYFGGDTGTTYTATSYKYSCSNACNFMVRLTRNSNESVTLPVGVTFMVPSGLAYSGKVSAPEGYIVKYTYDDYGTYYSLRVENQQTNVGTKVVNFGTEDNPDTKDDVPDIKVNETDITTTENYDIAKAVVEDIDQNDNVKGFSDVNINPALKDNSSAKDEEQKLDVVLKGIKVENSTEYYAAAVETKSVYSETFDVKPMVQVEAATDTTVMDEQGNFWEVIPNEEIEGEITFRLPVKKEIAKEVAAVYHQANAGADKTLLGFYPIEGTAENGKYIELSASEFSIYTYEVMTGVSTSDKLVIKHNDGTFTGYSQLITTGEEPSEVKGAVSEYLDVANGDAELILMQDYAIGAGETFDNKEIKLELNGHKLTGDAKLATGVTVQNSGADKDTLAAPGQYANDVTAFAADGYDTRKTAIDGDTLFKKDLDNYIVIVTTAPGAGTSDRDTTNDDPTKNLDVFAGDKVKVTVKVEGGTFAAANVTLKYDKENFVGPSAPIGWTKVGENGYNFYNYKTGNKYYKNGEILGTFTFTVKEGDSEKLNEMFTVSTSNNYIAPQWSSGWESNPAAKLENDDTKTQLVDDFANIRLKQMTATVNPNTGLVYKEVGQKLLADGYTATDNLSKAAITDATIKYAVLTKEQVNGVLYTGETGQTESTTVPGYVEGKEPQTPAAADYKEAQPMMTNADDYVIFWQVSRLGYITVSGQESVSIAPLDVTLTWTMPGDQKAASTDPLYEQKSLVAPAQEGTSKLNDDTTYVKTNPTEEELTNKTAVKADFFGGYSPEGFYFSSEDMNLTGGGATTGNNMFAFVNALNKTRTAKITMTEKPDTAEADTLKVVGTYKFTADLGSNYHILNPEITVLIDGAKITGFDFEDNDPVYFDGQSHVSGTLTNDTTAGVTVEFRYSKDGGETWEDWVEGKDKIPALTDANAVPYKVEMRLSAEGSYTRVESIDFSIKPVQYYVEKSDYVVGWDLVLCYTDEAVPSFNYDGKPMYDVSAFGYKLGTVWNADGTEITVEGTGYTYVYGIVVEGNAEINKVLPSNNELGSDMIVELSGKGRLDVNKSTSIDINDLVAVAAVYNVNKKYLAPTPADLAEFNLSKEQVAAILLRADVSGNKMVDTYDCSLIKTNSI